MSDEEFERHKEALRALKLEKPKRLAAQYSLYINEIALQQYHFDRSEKEVEILSTITKDQIVEYYKVCFMLVRHAIIMNNYFSSFEAFYCS